MARKTLKFWYFYDISSIELNLMWNKWTWSYGCFEIVSAINGLIRLFDTSSPFITPGQWFMPSNWQWVVINFLAPKNTAHTLFGLKLIPSTLHQIAVSWFCNFRSKILLSEIQGKHFWIFNFLLSQFTI